jgi:hypothetical protein
VLLTAGLAVAPGQSWGHLTPSGAIRADQFTDDRVPVVDADLSDWAGVGSPYWSTTEVFTDLVHASAVDNRDLGIRLGVGWNPTVNRLWVAATVIDDIHQVDRPAGSAALRIFQDDAMEVFIDADHSGGQFANFVDLTPAEQLRQNGTQANHFVIAGPPPDGDFLVNFSAAAWYSLANGPYTAAAYRLRDLPAGGTEITYEAMFVPFDRLDVNAVFLSDEHRLREGQVLGFNVEIDDYDRFSELLDAKWSLSGGQNSFQLADRFTDLMLMPLDGIFPTAAQGVGWGALKGLASGGWEQRAVRP